MSLLFLETPASQFTHRWIAEIGLRFATKVSKRKGLFAQLRLDSGLQRERQRTGVRNTTSKFVAEG